MWTVVLLMCLHQATDSDTQMQAELLSRRLAYIKLVSCGAAAHLGVAACAKVIVLPWAAQRAGAEFAPCDSVQRNVWVYNTDRKICRDTWDSLALQSKACLVSPVRGVVVEVGGAKVDEGGLLVASAIQESAQSGGTALPDRCEITCACIKFS